MPRPETGSFNRLLTSLGLLLLAGALVIPYFYYRSTGVLEIEEQQLQLLTVTARESIEQRQNHIADLQPYVLPLSGVLVAAGVGFLLWGGLRLRGAQDLDDREAEARTKAAEAGLRDLTPEEREDKLQEAVAPTEPRASTGGEERSMRRSGMASPSTSLPAPQDSVERWRAERRTRIEAARRVETAALTALAEAEFEGYRFRPQVAVGKLKLDGLFLSEEMNRPDVLLEIRVMGRVLTPAAVDRVLSRVARYEAERGRRCRAWLLVVLTDASVEPQGPASPDASKLRERLDAELEPLGAATVLRDNEISALGQLFPYGTSS